MADPVFFWRPDFGCRTFPMIDSGRAEYLPTNIVIKKCQEKKNFPMAVNEQG